jgi:UDP-glucose:(heptosyl)LPS alpha-1,3-glucosyltransferase
MRVAFSIFKYFPYGGIQRDLMKLVDECRQRDMAVRIYAAKWLAPMPEGIDLRLAPVRALTNHVMCDRFARWVRTDLAQDPADVVVGMNKMPGLDVYYAGDSCYLEKAMTQRSIWYRLLPRFRSFVAQERAVFDPNGDTLILTISRHQKPTFRRWYGTPDLRFRDLPPGIERDRVAPADAAEIGAGLRREFGVAERDRLLLFIGSGFVKKGLDRALRALRALPARLAGRTWLFVVGEDNAEPFRRMSFRLGVGERVRFLGGRPDVPRLLFGADGLVLPAYDENAGMVILEAMVAGLPALVTHNCGYAHYLERAGAGIVAAEPFDQGRFDAQLVELLESPERETWSARGRGFATEDIYSLVPRAVDLIADTGARAPLVAFCLFHYFPYGGLQRDFLKVALECLERGLRVRVYAMEWRGELPAGIDWVEVPTRGLTNHARVRHFADWVLADLERRPAACVIGFNRMPGLDVYYAADSCFEEKARALRRPGYRLSARYRLFARFERAVFDPAADTLVLAITARQIGQFQHHYDTPAERFRLMPPGLGRDRRRPVDARELRAALRTEYGLDDRDRLLLLIGSAFVTKGVDRAITALAALPPELAARTRLFVLGEDAAAAFETLATRLGVGERVQFLGGRNDVPRFLLGADLMVHPAYLESGGIALLEALVNGLPVIASGSCGFAPHIEHAAAGVVLPEPFVQADLDRALAAALADDEARAAGSANGIRYGTTADLDGMAECAGGCIEAHARGQARGPDPRADARPLRG